MKNPPSRLRADLGLVLIALIWGSTFVLVKRALDDISTVLFLALRFSLAAVALWFTFRGRGSHYPRSRKTEWQGGLVVGMCLFAGYLFQTAGLKYTTPAKAGFITGFYIPLVPLVGAVIYRRAPVVSELIGVVLATVGMALMTVGKSVLDIARGDLLVLGCAFAYAFHILALGHFSKRLSYESLSLNQVATCAMLSLGVLLVDRDAAPRLELAGDNRARGDQPARDGLIVFDTKLGSAVHHAHPHRPDLLPRAGVCLDNFLSVRGRTIVGASRHWCRPDTGRHPDSGIETHPVWPSSILVGSYNRIKTPPVRSRQKKGCIPCLATCAASGCFLLRFSFLRFRSV